MEEETQFEEIEGYLEENFYDIFEDLDFYQYMRGTQEPEIHEAKEQEPTQPKPKTHMETQQTLQNTDPFATYKTEATNEPRNSKAYNDPFGTSVSNLKSHNDTTYQTQKETHHDIYSSKQDTAQFDSDPKQPNTGKDQFADPFGEKRGDKKSHFAKPRKSQSLQNTDKGNEWMFGSDKAQQKKKLAKSKTHEIENKERNLRIVDEEKSIKTDSEMEGMKDTLHEFRTKMKHSISQPPVMKSLIAEEPSKKRFAR